MDYITVSAFQPLCVSASLYMHRIETIPFLSFPSSTTFGLYIGGSTRVGLMSEIRMSLGEPPIESCEKTKPRLTAGSWSPFSRATYNGFETFSIGFIY